ncbi:MAG: hydrogenase maturation nickel metallochaperone HypA [Candidatus Omnitrophica bacterium]|nr:hydrogenase maturation nickel metallochaperone HypA [Candidatus Omnitrophota bacterium]
MHESHQVQHLIKHAQELLLEKKIVKPSRITILVGEALGFDEMSVRLHWEEFALGTPLESAQLVVNFAPVNLKCPACQFVFSKKKSQMDCPKCHTLGQPTDSGKEFKIVSIH